jgi:drug/metabolite transporter (DMT)-like permease
MSWIVSIDVLFNMNPLFLYILVVLTWGTTWIAIQFQLKEAPLEVSVFYRFALASLVLLTLCRVKGWTLRYPLREHFFIFLLGLCVFSVHVVLCYTASQYLVSGLVSVLFSLVSVFNLANAYLFFDRKPSVQMLGGACLGVCGIALFFLRDISFLSFGDQVIQGVFYGVLGALLFSLGNMVSRRNQRRGLLLIPSSALAMCYGSLAMGVYCVFKGSAFVLPTSPSYWGSLVYLVLGGTVFGFMGYLALVSRLGPERAGYATVLFPIVAVLISSLFEGYVFSVSHVVGILSLIVGNVLMLAQQKQPSRTSL